MALWKRWKEFSEFIAECEIAFRSDHYKETSAKEWLEWAKAEAEKMNPMKNGEIPEMLDYWASIQRAEPKSQEGVFLTDPPID